MSTELIRQLEDRPLCAWCLAQGRITVAVAADYADRELESLCGDCFDRKTNLPAELGYVLDIGLDGIRSTAVIRSIDRASRDVACYKDRTMISLEQASSRLAHEAAP